MSTYMAGYGAGEERREKLVRGIAVGIVLGLILLTVGYFGLRNLSKRQKLDRFMALLEQKNFEQAYSLWGCTPQTPCRDYSLERFLRDWGPESVAAQPAQATLLTRATCGTVFKPTGILRAYKFPSGETVQLWVNAEDENIGFAPTIGRLQCTILP